MSGGAIIANVRAFQPYAGGKGVRFTCTTSSGSTQNAIPGLENGADEDTRVSIYNAGSVDASVLVQIAGQSATINEKAIGPGIDWVFTPIRTNSQLYIYGITVSGSTSLQVTAGTGS